MKIKNRIIEKVLTKLSKKKEKVPGGLGDGRPDSDFDPKQLAKGIEIEVEHTKDKDLAKEIAKDHLTELPNYYINDKGENRLQVMEQEAEKELKNKK